MTTTYRHVLAVRDNVKVVARRAESTLMLHQEPEAMKWFFLLSRDVVGATISLSLFDDLRMSLNPPHNTRNYVTAMLYHASCFICDVARAVRVLNSPLDGEACFRDSVHKIIKQERGKNRQFFRPFREARNAIEHIEVESRGEMQFFNMLGNRFDVIDGVSVEVSQASLNKLHSAHDAIAKAIIAEYRDPAFDEMNDILDRMNGPDMMS